MPKRPEKTTTSAAFYKLRNRALRSLGFNSYDDYLKSDLWQSIRSRVLKRDNDECRLCGRNATCAHHMKYTVAALKGKDISEIYSFCHGCHRGVEFTSNGEKLTSSHDVAEKMRRIAVKNRVPKAERKSMRQRCRCCQFPKKTLGRNQICLTCYKRYGQRVHEMASRNDDGYG